MKEFDFIRQYLQRQQQDAQLVLGIGDDAAIIRPRAGWDLCFSSDMLVAGRHFFADVSPADLAYKVMAVNISDMAAMGARPRWVLLSAALPELEAEWLQQFCDSLFAIAQVHGITLIGGDTTKGPLVFNVTIAGELPQGRALRRDGAQVGDDIWVTGQLGLAAAALNHHWQTLRLPEVVFAACELKRLRPEPRVVLGQALLPLVNAAQDVSDGLAQDVGHILAASKVGAILFADEVPTLPALKAVLPLEKYYEYTLAGGDDYELVFTASPQQRAAIEAAGEACGVAVWRVGEVRAATGLDMVNARGEAVVLDCLGFDHFG